MSEKFKGGDRVVFTKANPDGGAKYGKEGTTATIKRWVSHVGTGGEF